MRQGWRATFFGIVLVLATIGTATATTTNYPDRVSSTWLDPGSAPLDGMGIYVYIAAPSPAAGLQLPPNYLTMMKFVYVAGAPMTATLGLGEEPTGERFVLVTTLDSVLRVPYAWEAGRLYFLMVHALADGVWGSWVFDVWAGTSTFVASWTTPVSLGRISPMGYTGVAWMDEMAASPCASYPRTDVFFTPPIGIRAGTFTLATPDRQLITPRGCPSEISDFQGWTYFRLGTGT